MEDGETLIHFSTLFVVSMEVIRRRLHYLIFYEDPLYMREFVRKCAVVGLLMMIASKVDDCD